MNMQENGFLKLVGFFVGGLGLVALSYVYTSLTRKKIPVSKSIYSDLDTYPPVTDNESEYHDYYSDDIEKDGYINLIGYTLTVKGKRKRSGLPMFIYGKNNLYKFIVCADAECTDAKTKATFTIKDDAKLATDITLIDNPNNIKRSSIWNLIQDGNHLREHLEDLVLYK